MPKVSHAGLLIGFCEPSFVWAPDNEPGSPRAGVLRQGQLTQASRMYGGSSMPGAGVRERVVHGHTGKEDLAVPSACIAGVHGKGRKV